MAEGTNEIQKKIDALPAEVKSFLYSKEMGAAVQQIGAKHQLHIDQIGALESEVAAAMIGVTEVNDLAENISDALNLDKGKSDLVAKDVGDQIFSKVRGSMKANTPPRPPVQIQAAPAPQAAASAPVPAATPIPVNTPKPATLPAPTTPTMPKVDTMLSQPTVSVAPKPAPAPTVPISPAASVTPSSTSTPAPAPSAPATPPQAPAAPKPEVPKPPSTYKTDPYREPIEP